MTVAVAMSGGVDSSVAALKLLEAGYRVFGVHMRLFDMCKGRVSDMERSCCSPAHEWTARKVAHTLGIPFYIVDLRKEFKEKVSDVFGRAYAKGLTPNPCILCNESVKFDALIKVSREMGAQALSTGHYAKIVVHNGRHALVRPRDRLKDQTYFLYVLRQEILEGLLFPLSDLTKEEVRKIAGGLPCQDVRESQEVCFLGGEPYWTWLARHGFVNDPEPGEIVDKNGKILGQHQGVHRFTIGKRHGLGGGQGVRMYVIGLDPLSKRVIVGKREDLVRTRIEVSDVIWCGAKPETEFEAQVMIRYRDHGHRAVVTPGQGSGAVVTFHEPVYAVAPGQAAVFYVDDVILGGGTITR